MPRVQQIDKDYWRSSHAVLMDAGRNLRQTIGWLERIEAGLPPAQIPPAIGTKQSRSGVTSCREHP